MSYESISTIIREVDTSLWDLISHVLCSICHELPINPVTTPCEHSFCGSCIKRFLSSKDNSGCPLCKHPLKKYSLQQDMVKLKISRIFQELPQAFINDVKDLQSSLDGTTGAVDLAKTSKLFQLSVLENQAKSVKTNEKKSAANNEQNKVNHWEDDYDENGEVGTFAPVVKRDKKDAKYKNAKGKKIDGLISISQTETVSSLSGYNSKELSDDLAGIERVPPCEKVKQWFQSTGDESTMKIRDSTGKNPTSDETEGKCNERHCSSAMIRVDYKKFLGEKECGTKKKIYVDPYEIVPSQRNKLTIRKRNKSIGKIILDKKETSSEDVAVITASQKLNQLRAESDFIDAVQTERRERTLFSGTQLSSVHFSDCSSGCLPQCGSEDNQNKKPPEFSRVSGPDVGGVSAGPRTNCRKTGYTEEPDVTLDRENSFTRTSYTDIIHLKSYEALELENDVETYLKRFGGGEKKIGLKETKKESGKHSVTNGLLNLLEEVYLDDALYSNHPVDAPLKLPGTVKERNVARSPQETFTTGEGDYPKEERGNSVLESFQSCENLTPTSNLIGFGTQHSVQLPPRQILRNMVADMEKDLLSRERDFFQSHETISTAALDDMVITVTEATVSADKEECQRHKPDSSGSGIPPAPDEGPESRKGFIKFLRAGHLTPFPRRPRSSVVKLVFPAGLGRKRFSRAVSAHVQPSIHGLPVAGSKTLCSCEKNLFPFAEPTSRVCSKAIQMSTTQADERRCGKGAESRGTEISRKASFPGKTGLGRSGDCASTGVQTSPVATASVSIQASAPSKLACSVAVQTLKFEFEVVRDSAKILGEDPCNTESTRTDSLENDNMATLDALPLAQFSVGTQKRKMEEGGARVSKKLKTREQILNVDDEKSNPNRHRDILAPDHDSAALPRSNLMGHVNSVSQNKEVNHFSGKTTANYQNSLRKEEVKKSRKESTEMSQEAVAIARESGLVFEVDARNPNPNRIISVNPSTPQKSFLQVTENDADAGEESEESDSDLFVEQTPPRGSASAVAERRRFGGRPKSTGEMLAKRMESAPNTLEPQGGHREAQGNAMAQKDTNNLGNSGKQSPWATRVQGNPPKENIIARAVSDTWKKFDFGRDRKASLPLRKRFHLVASSVHNPEKIKKFASEFKMEYSNKANKDMTHLIVGLHENDDGEVLPLCTPKLLFAMANKKWVVSEAWAEACLKASKVVDENEFETRDPLGGSACRTARLSNERLFKTCQICLLGTFENILKEELADLVMDSGGTLVSRPESFSLSPSKMRLIIADGECLSVDATELQRIHERFRSVVLSRDFLIMSIQSQKLSIFGPYLLHPTSPEKLIEMGYPDELLCQEESSSEM